MKTSFKAVWSWAKCHAAATVSFARGKFLRTDVIVREVKGGLPKKLAKRILYIVIEDGLPWQASMICPCGCGQVLDMNLLPDERPRWKYQIDARGRASLKPSVWRKVGCKSHFWLRHGKIDWV